MTSALIRWKQLSLEKPDRAAQILREALEAIPSSFHKTLALQLMEGETKPAYSEMREALAAALLRLLDRDMNRLMQIFYRVDVSEAKVNQAFQAPFSDIPLQLADLLIERQLQKLFIRDE